MQQPRKGALAAFHAAVGRLGCDEVRVSATDSHGAGAAMPIATLASAPLIRAAVVFVA